MLDHEALLERMADSAHSRSYMDSGESQRPHEPASQHLEKENLDNASQPNPFAYDSIVYEQCPHCNRKFFEGKLPLHLKSCKPGKLLKKKPPSKKEPLSIETAELKMSKTFDSMPVEAHLIPQVNTPRLPAQQEEENEFLKPSDMAIRTAYIMNSASETTALSECQPRDSLQHNPSEREQARASDGQLKICQHCNRKFNVERIEKHLKACQSAQRERPVFNSKLKRVQSMGMQIVDDPSSPVSTVNRTTMKERYSQKPRTAYEPSKTATAAKPKWKVEHENFINSIRCMKQQQPEVLSEMMQGDGKQPVHVPLEHPEYVECRYCHRRFAPNVAAIHIPKCQNIINRPRPPTDKSPKLAGLNGRTTKQLAVVRISSIKCLDDGHGEQPPPIRSVVKSSSIQSEVLDKPKELARLSKNTPIFHKKPPTQLVKIEPVQEVNTFAGFVKKYEDVVTRTTKFSTVECPHCLRKFNDRASERHVPICAQLHRFKRPEKKAPTAPKRGNSCRLEPNAEQFCAHCSFKFSLGHKYCSNCGKKRQ